MGVDLRNCNCADDLASDIGVVGEQAVARIMDAVRATDLAADKAEHPLSEMTSTSPDQPSAATDFTDPQQVRSEIAFHQLQAAAGDAAAARRVAELCELINSHEDAAAWWHRAAELGDANAEAYVRYTLTPEKQDRPAR
jgi:hypothetical protein